MIGLLLLLVGVPILERFMGFSSPTWLEFLESIDRFYVGDRAGRSCLLLSRDVAFQSCSNIFAYWFWDLFNTSLRVQKNVTRYVLIALAEMVQQIWSVLACQILNRVEFLASCFVASSIACRSYSLSECRHLDRKEKSLPVPLASTSRLPQGHSGNSHLASRYFELIEVLFCF